MKCRFTLEDQLAFAKLSGDYNPLHVDPVAARRLLFGAPVVHGVQGLLWGLDNWLRNQPENIALTAINAVFKQAIRVGDEVRFVVTREAASQVDFELRVFDTVATQCTFNWTAVAQCDRSGFTPASPPRQPCRQREVREITHATGQLELYLDIADCAARFPALAERLVPLQSAQLLATTRLVGMECPGLHSLYSALKLSFDHHRDGPAGLGYTVTQLDNTLGLASIELESRGLSGALTALLRPPAQAQIGFAEAQMQVSMHEFAQQQALIIGGGRGLGETAAKLLAAGGSEIRITYHQGAQDARRVVEEITEGGGSAAAFRLDVREPAVDVAAELGGWTPTHLYYFATPFIGSGTKNRFAPAHFRTFCDYYIDGFIKILEPLLALGLTGVFYPSSVFVDQLPADMAEYAAAKTAGETLCAFLEKNRRDLVIHRPRLPKMATDQTAGLLATDNQVPAPVMLMHLRHLQVQSLLRSGMDSLQ